MFVFMEITPLFMKPKIKSNMKNKINSNEFWLYFTYGFMTVCICFLMYEVVSLKDEVKTLKEIKLKK
jgi:hypothetical protein